MRFVVCLRATGDSPVSAEPQELLALLDPVVLLDLLVTMVLR